MTRIAPGALPAMPAAPPAQPPRGGDDRKAAGPPMPIAGKGPRPASWLEGPEREPAAGHPAWQTPHWFTPADGPAPGNAAQTPAASFHAMLARIEAGAATPAETHVELHLAERWQGLTHVATITQGPAGISLTLHGPAPAIVVPASLRRILRQPPPQGGKG